MADEKRKLSGMTADEKRKTSGATEEKRKLSALADEKRKLSGSAATNPAAKPANVNERTYQEVEYLKKNLGPILVAALAEICIRRPADPIEYLGHWLLRWRYNEELKRRDVQNALDVVRQKQWAIAQEGGKPDVFSQG